MKNKSLIIILSLICVLAIVSVILINKILFGQPNYETISNKEASKMFAALTEDFEEITWQGENTYVDYLSNKPFIPDYDANEPVINDTIIDLFKYFGLDVSYLNQFDMKLKANKRAVKKEVFLEIYDYIVSNTKTNVYEKNMIVVATPGSVSELEPWNMYTNEGKYTFYGLFMDGYLDNEITAYMVGNDVVAVKNIVSKQVTYRNVWIYEGNNQGVKIYYDGINRTFYPDKLEEDIKDVLGDITVVDGVISSISVKNDRVNGKVLAVTDNYVEIEGYGRVEFDPEYRLFNNYNGFSIINFKDILVGYDMEDFIVADGMICGVILNHPFEIKNIRVMIRNNNYEELYHNQVTVSCKGDFYVLSGKELDNKELIKADKTVTFGIGDAKLKNGRVRIEPVDVNDRIKITSISRSQGKPEYPGFIEIGSDDKGLFVINEVDMEQYLKLVVPSEMPAGYGIEASKVQAVCARSYAYNQLLNNDYREYGAHIDDSTWYQVYNNTKEYDSANRAVDETRGQVMTRDGEVITAYYYSTSCGYGSDISIWGQDADSCAYIKPHSINPTGEVQNLTSDEAFHTFITSVNKSDFDSSFALYRWHTTLTLKQINNLYKDKANVGDITSIEVTERLEGGIANRVLIKGSKGEFEICGEGSIRKTLGDKSITWINNNGKTFSMAGLPSAFISIVPVLKKGALTGYEIYGGGFGHGLGMSQNGAYQMTKEKYSYQDILRFFYDGIEIETIY